MELSEIDLNLCLLGGGNMGRALLEAWLDGGLAPKSVQVLDPAPSSELQALASRYPIHLAQQADTLSDKIDVLVLAVKPQIAATALPDVTSKLSEDSLVLSVAAGKTLAFLQQQCAPAKVIRTIPNTPCLVARGATGAIAGPDVSENQRMIADTLLSSVGIVEWVEDEKLIDAITALSGSGPAYLFHMVEAMAAAGEKLGLSSEMSLRLARATIEGAGELLHQSDLDASQLRINVTSPQGTTAAALDQLMREQNGLAELMSRAMTAARDRSEELGKD
jgi:pyrroline-5-carboxylate reductase